jgi:C_GCAxxG_C_C family probable redox protein
VAKKITAPFAGGSGEDGFCGAISGAYMVIGLERGSSDLDNSDAFKDVLSKIETISEKFRDKNETIKCVDLIGVEVFTEDGFEDFKRENIKEAKCCGFVSEIVKTVEEILSIK